MASKSEAGWILLWLFVLVCAFRAATSCSYLQPPIIGFRRTCSLVNKSSGVRVAWYEGKCAPPDAYTHYGEVCPGHTGMKLTLQCPPGLAMVCEGGQCSERTPSPSSITILNLQTEDAGEYWCTDGGGVLLPFNVTVETRAAIGVDKNFCGLTFSYDTTYKCCRNRNLVVVETSDVPRWFYVFGTDEVTIQHRWLTSARDHYPTDLGLVPDRNFNSSYPYFRMDVTNFPKTIDKELKVLVNISAADNFTSQSVCVELGFPNLTPVIYANQTLPLNTTISEGDTATFECELGTYRPMSTSEQFIFKLHRPSQNDSSSELVWNATCYVGYSKHPCENVVNGQHYRFNYTILQNLAAFLSVRYTLQILNVTEDLNKSSFTCSIISENLTQWQHTADLTVTTTTAPSLTAPQSSFPLQAVVSSCVLLSLVMVCGLVVTMGILLARKRWRQRCKALEPDQVPLTNQTMCDSEANTPVAAAEDWAVGSSVPTLQIVESGNGGMNGLLVGEPMPVSDRDLGYISSEDLSMAMNGRRTPPNTLGLRGNSSLPSRISKSDSDLLNHQSDDIEPAIDFTCIVYISYTDRMAGWVRNQLKPLIESWEHSEVVLHEDEMIPGFPVSGERQRLILQAHKVVLVVSRDYSESAWCLYELQHAIEQEPALCRGRIIPILVDGCQTLPSIVKGVVPLLETDRNFGVRLKKNILGHL